MLQRDGVVMVKMKVLVMRMMVMMIPMKSSPAGELFSLWCFLPRRGGGVYL
jgi:hypothetical protein